jgi:hypothetical protein
MDKVKQALESGRQLLEIQNYHMLKLREIEARRFREYMDALIAERRK